MANTILTTEQPSQLDWHIWRTSTIDVDDSVAIVSPEGFSIALTNRADAETLLIELIIGKPLLTPDGSRLSVDFSNDTVTCIDADPWLNPYQIGKVIGKFRELLLHVAISLRYLK